MAAPLSPDSEPKAELYQLVPTLPSDGRRNAHKIIRPLYSPSGRLLEAYIDLPVEPERGDFIDIARHLREPAGPNRRDSVESWVPRPSPSSSPTTPSPEWSRSSSPPNSLTPFTTIVGQGLGLYIPQLSLSDLLPLSASGTQFHTPLDESAEMGAYPLDFTPPASVLASFASSASSSADDDAPSSRLASRPPPDRRTDGSEDPTERILPSARPLSRSPEPGDDVAVRNGNPGGGGGVEFDIRTKVDGVLGAADGEADSRSRSDSGGSNHGSSASGESKRASRSADELRQDSGPAGVQIDSPTSSPRNPDAEIVARSDQLPLQVIQSVDTEADADAYSPKREPVTDTSSSSPIWAVDPSVISSAHGASQG